MQVVPQAPRVGSKRGQGKIGGRGGTLGLALAAGFAAALLAFLIVRGRLPVRASGRTSVFIVVAARDIPARTRLQAKWLRVRSVLSSDAPDGAVPTVDELVGKVTTEPIAKGAAVMLATVTVSNSALGLAFALPPSERAMTITLDPADSPEQFAKPGDHVDLLATNEPGEPGGSLADARTVLQNVKLLAVGGQTVPDAAPPTAAPTSPAHVTVAVTPSQAQLLVQAAARGKLHLSLRPVDDDAIASLPVFPAMPSVRGMPRPAPPRKSPLRPAPAVDLPEVALPPLPVHLPAAHVTIVVIKGSQSQTVSVEP